MVRTCEGAHCSAVDKEINEVCKSEGWPIGHPVITRDSKGVCQCHCSCMALNTPVLISEGENKAIQDFKKGDSIYAAGLDLIWSKKEVVFSQGTTGNSKQPLTIYIDYGEDQHIIVTPDHLFLMPTKKLKRADNLTPEDYLINQNGEKIKINNVTIGDFYGGFHHIATDTKKPTGNLDGHLIVANGIVCADYALQIYYRSNEMKEYLHVDDMLTVGTKEYKSKYGVLEESNIKNKLFSLSSEQNIEKRPDDAVSFLPEEAAKKYQQLGMFRSFTDPTSRAWVEYLFDHFKAFYPEINYLLDWDSEVVNAYAWKTGGKRYIQLLGGLVRSQALELEGISLIIAHEVAHHYAGEPTYPSGLSCEGQSDYYAANTIMRKVWFGEQYIMVIEKAINQLTDFFQVAYGEESSFLGTNTRNGCSHPPADCRIQTYNDAVNLKPKPACAE